MDDKNNMIEIKNQNIQLKIFTIRNQQVMLDRDLADLYEVQNKRLNEQVKRNIDRFLQKFRFQLKQQEKDELVANCDHLKSLKHSPTRPYVFTEQGISMLSAVLRSPTAIKVSIQIMDAFVNMRKFISNNAAIFQRLEHLEIKQLNTDTKLDKVLQALEAGDTKAKQGIFYDGQVFDAYLFIINLIKIAKHNIVLIDNYIDESVLNLLSKRKNNVQVIIYSKNLNKSFQQDLKKHNQQYSPITVKKFTKAHDRFLIIDDTTVYHFGASIKDLGKKWFAFSKMEIAAKNILKQLEKG
ncbi:MAG: ORF6N domain-containing protein [Proteobacteria bacterium]|nr:ORF6N domain-containing protein [Pseudomonadota bacterium]